MTDYLSHRGRPYLERTNRNQRKFLNTDPRHATTNGQPPFLYKLTRDVPAHVPPATTFAGKVAEERWRYINRIWQRDRIQRRLHVRYRALAHRCTQCGLAARFPRKYCDKCWPNP